jgi:hypothetical protein
METVVGPPRTDLGNGIPVREVRTQQARNLGAIIRQPCESVDSELILPFTRDERFDHVYGRLGEQLFIGFGRQAHASGDEKLISIAGRPAVLHGCYVMSRLLSYGPSAYADYMHANPEASPSLAEFTDIMKRSKGTFKTFADTDKKSNTTLEMNFGLLQYPPIYDDVPAFSIAPNKAGQLEFKESPVIKRRAMREILSWLPADALVQTKAPGDIYCPAVGIVLSTLWESGIDTAASDPALFAADFSRLGVPALA